MSIEMAFLVFVLLIVASVVTLIVRGVEKGKLLEQERKNQRKNQIEVQIRKLEERDRPQWTELWKNYCAFYGETISPEVTADVWSRLLDPDSGFKAFVAQGPEGDILGFTHSLIHGHTWSAQKLCYLEDLFVSEKARGKNVGFRLISHLIELGKKSGWSRVYWHTDTDNAVARRLYNRFSPADEVVRYTVNLK